MTEVATHYNYFRDYDPSIGRYVQSDAIGLRGGINTYGYVNGNSLRYSDPYGLFAGDGHSIITKDALGGEKCVDVDALATLTQDVDTKSHSQDPTNSHWHAMSNGASGESRGDAERKFNLFVDAQLGKCTLDGLANAMHAVQDSAAGGHKGFQPWSGGLPSASHMNRDFFPKPQEWDDAKQKSKDLMERYKRRCGCCM